MGTNRIRIFAIITSISALAALENHKVSNELAETTLRNDSSINLEKLGYATELSNSNRTETRKKRQIPCCLANPYPLVTFPVCSIPYTILNGTCCFTTCPRMFCPNLGFFPKITAEDCLNAMTILNQTAIFESNNTQFTNQNYHQSLVSRSPSGKNEPSNDSTGISKDNSTLSTVNAPMTDVREIDPVSHQSNMSSDSSEEIPPSPTDTSTLMDHATLSTANAPMTNTNESDPTIHQSDGELLPTSNNYTSGAEEPPKDISDFNHLLNCCITFITHCCNKEHCGMGVKCICSSGNHSLQNDSKGEAYSARNVSDLPHSKSTSGLLKSSGNGKGGNKIVSCLNVLAGPTCSQPCCDHNSCMVTYSGNGDGGNQITSHGNFVHGGNMVCCSGNGNGGNCIRSMCNIIRGNSACVPSTCMDALLRSLCSSASENCTLFDRNSAVKETATSLPSRDGSSKISSSEASSNQSAPEAEPAALPELEVGL